MNETTAFKRERKEQHETKETDTKKLIGKYKQLYGIEFHSQVVIVLETLQAQHDLQMEEQARFYEKQLLDLANNRKEMNDNFQQLLDLNLKANQDNLVGISKATSEINKNKKSIQTENPNVAIGDNVSKYGMWTLMMVVLAFLIFLGFKQKQEVENFYTFKERSPLFIKYRNFSQQGKIIANPIKELKGLYVELRKPKKGEKLQYGLNYYFDAPNERILVPLGLDENGKNFDE
jgi:hypothetical protein